MILEATTYAGVPGDDLQVLGRQMQLSGVYMDQSESAGGCELETVAIWAGPAERIQSKQATLKTSLGQPWLRPTKISCKGHSRG